MTMIDFKNTIIRLQFMLKWILMKENQIHLLLVLHSLNMNSLSMSTQYLY